MIRPEYVLFLAKISTAIFKGAIHPDRMKFADDSCSVGNNRIRMNSAEFYFLPLILLTSGNRRTIPKQYEREQQYKSRDLYRVWSLLFLRTDSVSLLSRSEFSGREHKKMTKSTLSLSSILDRNRSTNCIDGYLWGRMYSVSPSVLSR